MILRCFLANRAAFTVFAIVVGFGIAGSLYSEEAPRELTGPAEKIEEAPAVRSAGLRSVYEPHRISDQLVLADLNPTFLRIGLATIEEDESELRECAAELDRQAAAQDRNKIPAGLAKLVIYEKIPDQAAFAAQVATIASWERDQLEVAKTVSVRVKQYFADLIASDREQWRQAAVTAAGSTLWAGADELTIEIARTYVTQLAEYSAKAEFIARVLAEARSLAQQEKYPDDLKAVWNSGRQDLARLGLEVEATHFKFQEIWPALRTYLDEFGVEGRHSQHLFGLAMDTLNRARSQKIDFDPLTVPDRDWFQTWHEKLKTGGSEKTAKRLSNAWEVFDNWKDESLPLGRITVAELIRDPRLRVSFSGQFVKPRLAPVLEQIASDTSISMQAGPDTEPDLLLGEAAKLAGPVHAVMAILANLETVQGEWERTSEGYQLHSSRRNQIPAAINSEDREWRSMLVIGNVVVLGTLFAWWTFRRKKSAIR